MSLERQSSFRPEELSSKQRVDSPTSSALTRQSSIVASADTEAFPFGFPITRGIDPYPEGVYCVVFSDEETSVAQFVQNGGAKRARTESEKTVCIYSLGKDKKSYQKNLEYIAKRHSDITKYKLGVNLGLEPPTQEVQLDVIKALVEFLKSDTTITSLDCSGVSTLGAFQLFEEFLETNKSVTDLKLSKIRLSERWVKLLSDALGKNQHIKSLDLSSCGIGSVEANILLELLKTRKQFTELKLGGNKIDESILKDIATQCKINANPLWLHVGDYESDDEVATQPESEGGDVKMLGSIEFNEDGTIQ